MPCDVANVFLEAFLGDQHHTTLRQLLDNLWRGACPRRARLAIDCQKFPHSFVNWFERQMADLRYNNFAITFDLIVAADVFPASWASIRAYWGSQASDPNNFRSFRTGLTFIFQRALSAFLLVSSMEHSISQSLFALAAVMCRII